MSTALEDSEAMMPSGETPGHFEMPEELWPGQAEAEADVDSRHAVLVGSIGLLLPADEISELVERARVCRLPNTSTWFSGITSVRGSMIPVFDLHELFDIAFERKQRRLIVVGEHEKAVAFWVDGFPSIVSLGDDEQESSAPGIPSLIREHAREYFIKDGQAWVDCNIEGLVTTLGEMI